jgi:murein L,D-transpeptidase YafK
MIDKNSEIKSDLRTLTPGYAKRFPTKYAEKLSQLIKLKEAGFQFYKEEEKKLNKLIKENKEEGGEVKYLTDEEIEMYRAGGYVVEEL